MATRITGINIANNTITVDDIDLSTLDTDNVSEGNTNLYYTIARANTAIDARVTQSFVNALNITAADSDTLDGQQGSYYTQYTDNAIAALANSAPATLDTLNELAAALGDDANFSTTITNSLAGKLGANASITLTGDVTGSGSFSANAVSITATVADDSHNHIISNIDGLQTALDGKLASTATTFSGDATNKPVITTRTDSGFYEHDTATIADGWPTDSNTWSHLLAVTHSNDANYYSMQIAGSFFDSNEVYYRATNGNGSTGWSKIWHAGNDGSGSGLDADTLDGQHATAFMTPTYTGNVDITGELIADSYNETFVTLSGTTPTINCEAGNVFSLSTTGSTTFTFSNPPTSGTAYAFTLRVTAGGTHTLTWPASVDWAGGSAPDAPASGETDVYVFLTTDGGTNWYGFLAGDALA